VNLQELARFIVSAKKNTYAGKGEGRRGTDNSKNLQYEDGDYVYGDRYFGSARFGGEEVVWLKGEPVWLMNYYGGVENKAADSEKVFVFLRKALLQVSPEKPFRGPPFFRDGDFEYTNSSIGDVARFKGTERVTLRGEIIHTLEYTGGILVSSE